MEIRHAVESDLDALAALEKESYPPAEGAPRDCIARRLARFPDFFWLLTDDGGRLLAFINGMCTPRPDLADEMYADESLHDPAGAWLMLFSVVTAPDCRGRGRASALMVRVLADARAAGRRGVVLTCKAGLRGFYARFGFVSEGVSASTHGGAVWYQMRLRFEDKAVDKAAAG